MCIFHIIQDFQTSYNSKLQMSKHYQNDIKKQLGIDQTRTKSQKLLDSFAAKRNPTTSTLLSQTISSQPKKKIKQQNNESTDPLVVCQKLLKTISSSTTQISKKIKAITILRKCFTDKTFTDAIINNQPEFLQVMIQLYELSHQDQIMLITINQNRTLMDKIGQIWCDIQKLTKAKRELSQNLECQLVAQLQINYCKLFVDDSFSFIKAFNSLKQSLNTIFQQQVKRRESQNQQKSNEKQQQQTKKLPNSIEHCLRILNSLFKMPLPIQLETVKSSIIAFFKNFVINYLKIIITDEAEQKDFLANYNVFINKKKTGNDSGTSSLDVLNNKGKQQSLKVNITYGGGSDAWIQKQ